MTTWNEKGRARTRPASNELLQAAQRLLQAAQRLHEALGAGGRAAPSDDVLEALRLADISHDLVQSRLGHVSHAVDMLTPGYAERLEACNGR